MLLYMCKNARYSYIAIAITNSSENLKNYFRNKTLNQILFTRKKHHEKYAVALT